MYGSPVLQHKANLMGSPMVGSNWGLNSNYKSENAANLRTGNENKKCTKGNIYTDYNCYNGASPNKHNTTNEHRLFANLVHN
jgi:hypothetical protein